MIYHAYRGIYFVSEREQIEDMMFNVQSEW